MLAGEDPVAIDGNPAVPRRILPTTPKGMFGGATLPYLLAEPDVTVRALLRSADGFDDSAPGVEVCLAALDDPAGRAGDGHDGRTYELTGTVALDMAAAAATFGEVLGRRVTYVDVSAHDLAAMIREQDPAVTDEELEVSVLCHLRAWRDGGADLVTDTVTALTGRPATSLRAWIEAHREVFDAAPRVRDRVEGFLLRLRFAH